MWNLDVLSYFDLLFDFFYDLVWNFIANKTLIVEMNLDNTCYMLQIPLLCVSSGSSGDLCFENVF